MWLFNRKPRQPGQDSKELLRCYPPEVPVVQKYTYDPRRIILDKMYYDAMRSGADMVKIDAIRAQIRHFGFDDMLDPGRYDMDSG